MSTPKSLQISTRSLHILIAALLLVSTFGTATIPVAAQPAGAPQSDPYVCTDPLGCIDIGPTDPVHIGYALGLSGGIEWLGEDERNGAEVAIDDLGGVIRGHPILFDGVDSQCSSAGGTTAGTALAADPTIVAVLGTTCSNAAVTAMPILSAAGYSMVSPSNTYPSLTESGHPDNHLGYFRTIHTDIYQSQSAAQFAREELGALTAATIDDGGDYSTTLKDEFVAEFTSLGGTITTQESITTGQTDMSTELATILAGDPRMIFMPVFMPEGGHIINQARGTAGLENTFLLGSDGLYQESVVTETGSNVEGFMVTGPDTSQFSPAYESSFIPDYVAKFGHEPDSMFAPFAYDAIMIIEAAIQTVVVEHGDGSLHIGRQALRDALYATTAHPGLTGSLTCGPTGDCADPHIGVFEYHISQYQPELIWPSFVPLSMSTPDCSHGGLLQSVEAVDPLTVTFNLCWSDPTFKEKVAITPFSIYPQWWLEATSGPGGRTTEGLEHPVGTGPYMADTWNAGTNISFLEYPGYWGSAPETSTLTFTWDSDPVVRLTALQTSAIDGYDLVDPSHYATVDGDSNLQRVNRPDLNVLYIGMNNTYTPFDDPDFRRAIAKGLNRQYIVDNYYPPGSQLATHFTPCELPNGCVGTGWYAYDFSSAQTYITTNYPGLTTNIYYRDVYRGYLPDPDGVAAELQTQLAALGITATLVEMDSGTFISEMNAGNLDGFYLLGWGVDYPHVSNFLDFHFNENNGQFGDPFPDIYNNLNFAKTYADPSAAEPYYILANNAIRDHVPMVPIVHATSAAAYRADVTTPQASPVGKDRLALSDPGGRPALNFMQNAEPVSLFCADETDGESMRACGQVMEGLYTFASNDTALEAALATSCTSNVDLDIWTCDLRPGVTFHDGSLLDANDVVATFIMGLDESSPTHKGNSNNFDYYNFIWGSHPWDYDPWIQARSNNDQVSAYDWEMGTTLILEIDDPGTPQNPDYSATGTVSDTASWDSSIPMLRFHVGDEYDLQPDDVVSVTDGATPKDLTVTDLQITDIDHVTNIVTGVAPPGSDLEVWACWGGGCTDSRDVTADGFGDWSTDFDDDMGATQPTYDLQPHDWVDAGQWDAEGDGTLYGRDVPITRLIAVLNENAIEGRDWPDGAPVDILIEDPGTSASPDFTASATAYVPDWNPDTTYLRVDVPMDVVDLHDGVYVEMTDSVTTKTHTIMENAVTAVDTGAETISGLAAPGQDVFISVWDGPWGHEVADGGGGWTADFSGEYDIQPGTQGEVDVEDADWDTTRVLFHVDWVAPGSVPMVVALDNNVALDNFNMDSNGSTVMNILMETLYRNDANGNLVPAAALGYIVSPDKLTYTVTLRPDGFWSDGVPVTAQHYVDGLIHLLDPATNFSFAFEFYPIVNAQDFNEGIITDPNLVGVSAPFADTLVFTLSQPASHFAQLFSFPSLVPIREDLMSTHGDAWTDAGNYVGNGPYHLLEHDGAHLLVGHNPNYRDLGRLHYDQIGFSIIPAYKDRLAAYLSGDVDVLLSLPTIPTDPALAPDMYIMPWPGTYHLGFNLGQVPTDDPLVRMALASALDRRHLLDVVMEMPWRDSATGVIPPELPGHQGLSVGYDYNLTQAQTYLATAGYPGGAGLPPIEIYANYGHEYIIEEIADQWRTGLGITVNTNYQSWNDHRAFVEACDAAPGTCPAHALRSGWLFDYPDAYNILNDQYRDGYWTPGWNKTAFNGLLDLSELELDPTARLLLLQDAERLLVETDAATMPIYHYDQPALVRPGVYPAPVPCYTQYLDTWVPPFTPPADFDGNGSTEISVYRPSTNKWFLRGVSTTTWGTSGDLPVPADYDGNGSADVAVFRPSTGKWFIQGQPSSRWGVSGDVPVPGDYNGDGVTDIAVYRPSSGKWFIKGQYSAVYGKVGDIPVPGDYNGDGVTDIAVYRPSLGKWFVRDQFSVYYGTSDDIVIPGDYNGDGTWDVAIFRPSISRWFIRNQPSTYYGSFGDLPVPGDYDANGTWDVAVFRPSSGRWFVKGQLAVTYGAAGDYPLPVRDTNADGDPYH